MLVKYYSPTTNVCIIRVARDQHRIAWGAVTLLSSIEGQKYIPNVVHVSGEYILYHAINQFTFKPVFAAGTIKHAQLAAIRHNREIIARYRAQAKTPGQLNMWQGEFF
jgi:ribonuclease P/MRP protein subunit POP5